MKIASFSYFLTEGFESVFKNKSMSFASIATIIVCIFVLGIAFFTLENLEFNIRDLERNVNITVFLDENMTEDQIMQFKEIVLENPKIREVQYVSKEEGLKIFLAENDLSIEEFGDFGDYNPIRASFKIILKNNEDAKEVAGDLATKPQIVNQNNPMDIMEILLGLKKFVQNISAVIISILIFVGIILIGNTIRLTVHIRRNEIKIMKYIGATDWFVRWPFVIEGLFIGFIGTVIPLTLLVFLYNFFINMFSQVVPNGSESIIKFVTLIGIYNKLVPIALGIGLGMGIIGSLIIIRKHLRA